MSIEDDDSVPHEPAPQALQGLDRMKASLRGLARKLAGSSLEKSQSRIRVVALAFCCVYLLIVGRLAYYSMVREHPAAEENAVSDTVSAARPDIFDREGQLLATDVKTVSVFAEPRRLIDVDDAVDQLSAVLSDVNPQKLRQELRSKKGFVWVKRSIRADEKERVFRLGLPGVGFMPENKRVYPNGELAAHVLGFTDTDNKGVAGIEKYIDDQGLADLGTAGFHLTEDNLRPIRLSIDLRATEVVRDELIKGVQHFQAKSGASAIMDVNTGEVIALASYPDFDPTDKVARMDKNNIDRFTSGVYEMGSTFKALTIAMALDAHAVNLNSMIDARDNLHFGRFTIHDFEPQHRMLSLPEVFTFSSNIGAAHIAMMMGVKAQQDFLRKVGQLTRLRTELPENAEPLLPKNWSELNTITIAFGQGLAVAPLQAMMAVGALSNGGLLITPTFLQRSQADAQKGATRVISPLTSEELRYIMRLNAVVGSAKGSNIPGYFVGGKTGTAQKAINGAYSANRVFTTFDAILPADKPKYIFMTVMDDPQAVPESHGFHTAAWNSGVVTGKIIARAAPLLGLPPQPMPTQPFPELAGVYPQANQAPATGSAPD